MVRAVTFEHDGVLYQVRDFQYVSNRRSWVEIGSIHAIGRLFHAMDDSRPDRVYLFRRGQVEASDPETLARHFKYATVVR